MMRKLFFKPSVILPSGQPQRFSGLSVPKTVFYTHHIEKVGSIMDQNFREAMEKFLADRMDTHGTDTPKAVSEAIRQVDHCSKIAWRIINCPSFGMWKTH